MSSAQGDEPNIAITPPQIANTQLPEEENLLDELGFTHRAEGVHAYGVVETPKRAGSSTDEGETEEVAEGDKSEDESTEPKKTPLSNRLFFLVIGLLIALILVIGGIVFYISVNSASSLGDLSAYPGAGAVKTPPDVLKPMAAQFKTLNMQADVEMGLAHDDLTKVQDFYLSSMKEKGFITGSVVPIQGGQFIGTIRSFGIGIKVIVFTNKEKPKLYYWVIANTLTDKTASTANTEFIGLAAKPGDVLIMLVKAQITK